MSNQEWTREVTFDMLPSQYMKLAEVIGVEATIQLCETYGGASYYIPTTDALYAVARAKMIRREYNGQNVNRLAQRFGMTPRAVQMIVQDMRPNQINLFGELD